MTFGHNKKDIKLPQSSKSIKVTKSFIQKEGAYFFPNQDEAGQY